VGRAVVAAYEHDGTPTRLHVAGVDAQGARLE
jgi:hypothetical protein